jgi:hypothetical protein
MLQLLVSGTGTLFFRQHAWLPWIAKWLDYVEFTCTTKSLHLDVPCAKRKVLQSLEQFRIYTWESKLSTVLSRYADHF